MSLSAEQIAAACDLFSGLGDITARRMMGGLCLYHRGAIFAIVMGDGGIYLKAAGEMIANLGGSGRHAMVLYPRGARTAHPHALLELARRRP